jgi:type II secretion system protein J
MMRFRAQRRDARGGFTLLELLLATAVGAIVLLVINSTFFAALRLHNSTHEKIEEDLVVQRALGIVRKDLAGIMIPANPQATTSTLSGQLQSDVGTLNEIDNTSERITPDIHTSSGKLDGWTPFADVQIVAYYLSPTSDGSGTKSLVRVVSRNLLSASDQNVVQEQALLPGVASAAVSFFDGIDWLDYWDSTASTSLPTAIKFSLVMARDGGIRTDPAPIELIVPVLVKTTTTAQQEATDAEETE